MNAVPKWRPGAVFHKLILDEDGFTTGREITVYPMLWGNGRLCEGVLAAITYDHEWTYQTVGEAIHAAQDWDGQTGTSPSGDFTGYRCVHNGGDRISHAHGQDEKRARGRLIGATKAMGGMREAVERAGEKARRFSEQAAELDRAMMIHEVGKREPVDLNGKYHDMSPEG